MLRATPPGEDGLLKPAPVPGDNMPVSTRQFLRKEQGFDSVEEGDEYDTDDEGIMFDQQPSDAEFLQMVSEADDQALQYINQVNRDSWERGYRAFHQEHFVDSKYLTRDFNNRSKLFIPKTRGAVKKDLAATAASLFGSVDAVSCLPGDESDPKQRGSAAVMRELVNYRTDRASGKASIPWFHVAMGARQTSLITGICLSKQYWKLELKRTGSEEFDDEDTGTKRERDVWQPHVDRPESDLIAPENFVIDSAADWRNPAQSASYIIIKWPMRIDEIRRRQRDPRNPWKALDENILKGSQEGTQQQMESIRRAREQGLDRFDRSQTTRHFDIIWVWETFIRTAGQDWTFFSVSDKHLLTDPQPVEAIYPEQFGERPLALGYGSLEAFRIFPMSEVESWQQLQQESNDIRNLSLDALKQNIMPVTKVVRGRNVDLDQLRRRGQGSAIMVTKADDVTWEKAPDISAGVAEMTQKLDIEFDDLSAQQNYGTVGDNNQLGKTLGGLKLAAGAANAVQEYNIRIWIETWCEPVLTQIVRLEQFYESDPIILGIAGSRAQLLTKHGIDTIDDDLLENNVTVRVNVGLGAGDPQQRLAKFQSATQVALPLLQMTPDFQSQKIVIDPEAVMEEVFGAAGYRDGGKRFIKQGPGQQQNPMTQPQVQKLLADTQKAKDTGKAAILNALTNAAKIGINIQEEERQKILNDFDMHFRHMDQIGRATELGHSHGLALNDRQKAAQGLNPDGTPMLPPGAMTGGGDGGGPSDAGAGSVAPATGSGPPLTPPQDVGAGNAGVAPDDLGKQGVPAPNAGMQQQEDEANLDQQIQKAAQHQPRKRKVNITKRGPDGRGTEFEIEDHGGGPDHSHTLAQIGNMIHHLNKPRSVKHDASGKVTGIE